MSRNPQTPHWIWHKNMTLKRWFISSACKKKKKVFSSRWRLWFKDFTGLVSTHSASSTGHMTNYIIRGVDVCFHDDRTFTVRHRWGSSSTKRWTLTFSSSDLRRTTQSFSFLRVLAPDWWRGLSVLFMFFNSGTRLMVLVEKQEVA